MSHLPENKAIPAMPYVPDFVQDDMQRVKLKFVSGLVTKEKKVPVFSGKEGIEGLLYCEEAIREAFTYLNVTTGQDMFKLYGETLSGGAVRKWNNVLSNLGNAARDVNLFEAVIKSFYSKYTEEKSRNVMYDYLKSRECGKPFKASVADHVDRMEELYRYSSKLPGTVPALNDEDPDDADQIKELIFITFPEKWQEAFEDSHDVEHETQVSINRFMNRQRAKDNRYAKKKETKHRKKGDGGNKQEKETNGEKKFDKKRKPHQGNGSNHQGNKKKKGIKPDDTCPIHGGHKWKQCFDNKYGDNYRPPRQDRGGRNDRRDQHYNDGYHYRGDGSS